MGVPGTGRNGIGQHPFGQEPRIDYSEVAVERAERLIEGQETAWQEMFRDLKIEPLQLWYEEIITAPDEAVRQIAQHLGVDLIPDAAITVPAIVKQAETDAREWRERFTRAKGR